MLLNQAYCNKIPRAIQCGLLSACTLNIDLPAITCNSMSTDFCKDMTVCLYIFEASEIMSIVSII